VWRQLVASSALPAIGLLAIWQASRPRTKTPPPVRTVQNNSNQDLASGKLLVANPKLGDPNFAQSVVVLVEYDEDRGAMGLILNRRTKTPLSKVFPDVKGAKSDPVFEGGPVDKTGGLAIFRGNDKPDQSLAVVPGIWATGMKDRIEKAVASGESPGNFRLYIGYSGWGPGQLEHEVELGGWSVLRATPGLLFDEDPDSLWQRMQHQSETRIAGLPRVNYFRLPMTMNGAP